MGGRYYDSPFSKSARITQLLQGDEAWARCHGPGNTAFSVLESEKRLRPWQIKGGQGLEWYGAPLGGKARPFVINGTALTEVKTVWVLPVGRITSSSEQISCVQVSATFGNFSFLKWKTQTKKKKKNSFYEKKKIPKQSQPFCMTKSKSENRWHDWL